MCRAGVSQHVSVPRSIRAHLDSFFLFSNFLFDFHSLAVILVWSLVSYWPLRRASQRFLLLSSVHCCWSYVLTILNDSKFAIEITFSGNTFTFCIYCFNALLCTSLSLWIIRYICMNRMELFNHNISL